MYTFFLTPAAHGSGPSTGKITLSVKQYDLEELNIMRNELTIEHYCY